jgi:hypothetical protein
MAGSEKQKLNGRLNQTVPWQRTNLVSYKNTPQWCFSSLGRLETRFSWWSYRAAIVFTPRRKKKEMLMRVGTTSREYLERIGLYS